MAAEITESFLASVDVVALRNLMAEVGLFQEEPTLLYQDCSPAVTVAENRGSLPACNEKPVLTSCFVRGCVGIRCPLDLAVRSAGSWWCVTPSALSIRWCNGHVPGTQLSASRAGWDREGR